MCGCGCELAMILATARCDANASAATAAPEASSGTPLCPAPFEAAARAFGDAIDRIVVSIVERIASWGAAR